jgi:hypothetical protein
MSDTKRYAGNFEVFGTDSCRNFEYCGGRITLFSANRKCIECDPESYKNPELTPEVDFFKKELNRLQAERDAYRDALSYYADKMNWYDPRLVGGSDQNAIWKDSEDVLIKSLDKHIVIGGKKAREVLSRFEKEDGK